MSIPPSPPDFPLCFHSVHRLVAFVYLWRPLHFKKKFGNRVVMDRQFRFRDESGKLLYFWPSGKNFITILYYSPVVNEEFLRRYLEKYPSSL